MRLYGSVEEVVTMCIKDMAFFLDLDYFVKIYLLESSKLTKLNL